MKTIFPLLLFLIIFKKGPGSIKKNKKSSTSKKTEPKTGSTTTARIQKTFKIKTNSPEKISPEDLQIKTALASGKKTVKKSNYFLLSALWAHYQAYQQGQLTKDAPAPWEKIKTADNRTSKKWSDFVNYIKEVESDSWHNDIKTFKELTIKFARKVHNY